jgi:hypothetical protein
MGWVVDWVGMFVLVAWVLERQVPAEALDYLARAYQHPCLVRMHQKAHCLLKTKQGLAGIGVLNSLRARRRRNAKFLFDVSIFTYETLMSFCKSDQYLPSNALYMVGPKCHYWVEYIA